MTRVVLVGGGYVTLHACAELVRRLGSRVRRGDVEVEREFLERGRTIDLEAEWAAIDRSNGSGDGAIVVPNRASVQAGLGVEVMDVQAACRTYNILVAEDRKVAAALILG